MSEASTKMVEEGKLELTSTGKNNMNYDDWKTTPPENYGLKEEREQSEAAWKVVESLESLEAYYLRKAKEYHDKVGKMFDLWNEGRFEEVLDYDGGNEG